MPIARCEYVCPTSIRTLNAYSELPLREAHSLFFEFHGTEAGVAEQATMVQGIADAHGGRGFEWTTRPEDRTRLWNARHNALFAFLALRPGGNPVITDTCVPISRLAASIIGARAILDRAPFPTVTSGTATFTAACPSTRTAPRKSRSPSG